MADIKTKKKQEIGIKKLDKATILKQNLKSNIVNAKEKTKESYEKSENTAQKYAENKVNNTVRDIAYYTPRLNRKGRQNFEKTIQNIGKGKVQIKKVQKGIKNVKRKGKITIKKTKKNIKRVQNTVKSAKNAVKKTERTTKATIKTTKQVAKDSAKLTQRTVQMTRQAIKTTIQATKISIKTTINTFQATIKITIAIIKMIIEVAQTLISLIIAGGWVALLIVTIISIIALICTSIFGIFFSNENEIGNIKMSSIIREINTDFTNKITEVQKNIPHDDYEINSNKASWKDILSIYAVEVSKGKEQTEVITLDDKKVDKLKKIFWDINTISFRTEDIEKEINIVNEGGSTEIEKIKRKILYIDITSKSLEEMIELYDFNDNQRLQLAELQKDEYNYLWASVVYESSIGNADIVEVARSQIGNVGGQPYWSWYGFYARVEWCACFVSWCANECRIYRGRNNS